MMNKCECCGSTENLNHFDGHDYQYWAANILCDNCIKPQHKETEE